MTKLGDRLSRLEQVAGFGAGAHHVLQLRGQTADQALDAYGRGLIALDEAVIFEDSATAYRRICNVPAKRGVAGRPSLAPMTPTEAYHWLKLAGE